MIAPSIISLPLSPEIEVSWDELAEVAILSIIEGTVKETSVLVIAPSIINAQLARPITLMNECHFLVPLASREKVKVACKVGSFKAMTKAAPALSRWYLGRRSWMLMGGLLAKVNGYYCGISPCMGDPRV